MPFFFLHAQGTLADELSVLGFDKLTESGFKRVRIIIHVHAVEAEDRLQAVAYHGHPVLPVVPPAAITSE